MHNGLHRALALCALLCGTFACVSSHDVDGAGQALMGGSGGGGTGGSGSGGRSGSVGSAGRAGGGGGSPAVSCGSKSCMGTSTFGISLSACCTSDGKCGLDLAAVGFGGCEEANAPGAANAACPSQTIAGILPLSGCCKPNGTCGALDTFLGLGCISLDGGATSCTP